MAKEWAKRFYNSKRWKRCRESYISERVRADGGMCERCVKRLGEEVHHQITLTPENIRDPDVALNHRKLEYLCHNCHTEEHLGSGIPVLEFDEEGQPLPP